MRRRKTRDTFSRYRCIWVTGVLFFDLYTTGFLHFLRYPKALKRSLLPNFRGVTTYITDGRGTSTIPLPLSPFPFVFCLSHRTARSFRQHGGITVTNSIPNGRWHWWSVFALLWFWFPLLWLFSREVLRRIVPRKHTQLYEYVFCFCTQHGVGVSHSRAMEFGRIRLLRTYTPVCVWSCVLFCFRVPIRVCLIWQISCFGGNTRWHGWPWMDCVLGFAFYSFCVEKV